MQEFRDGSVSDIFPMTEFDERKPHMDQETAAIWFGTQTELLLKKKALRKRAGLSLRKRDEMKLKFLESMKSMKKLQDSAESESQKTPEEN